jgi:hypothetical protein
MNHHGDESARLAISRERGVFRERKRGTFRIRSNESADSYRVPRALDESPLRRLETIFYSSTLARRDRRILAIPRVRCPEEEGGWQFRCYGAHS